MSAHLIDRNDNVKSVKNFGWLLKNWQIVCIFIVKLDEKGGCELIANLTHDKYKIYSCYFRCASVCYNFLNRPIFSGLDIRILVNGSETPYKIGSREYEIEILNKN